MGSDSLTGIKPGPPALGVRSLNHQTTRDVPEISVVFRNAIWLAGAETGTRIKFKPLSKKKKKKKKTPTYSKFQINDEL